VIADVDGVLWKLNRYYDAAGSDAEDWELHDLTSDPEERTDLSGDTGSAAVRDRLRAVLGEQRTHKRLAPTERRVPG